LQQPVDLMFHLLRVDVWDVAAVQLLRCLRTSFLLRAASRRRWERRIRLLAAYLVGEPRHTSSLVFSASLHQ
jgi:hypothetical protein